MSKISSLQNRRVKEAIKLRAHRARRKQGRCLIDGLREIHHALEGGVDCQELFVCEELLAPDGATLLQRLIGQGCARWDVTLPVWEKLTFGNRQSGLLVVAQLPSRALDQLVLPGQAFVVVIEGLEKPGNVGAVIRSADGAGADGVLIAADHGDLFNPNTIRASLGTVFRQPVAIGTSRDVLAWLRRQQMTIYAAVVGAERSYTEVDLRSRAALVLGSEAEGLTDLWRADDVQAIQIPMRGCADSLNVSAAAAVLCYEAARQRGT